MKFEELKSKVESIIGKKKHIKMPQDHLLMDLCRSKSDKGCLELIDVYQKLAKEEDDQA